MTDWQDSIIHLLRSKVGTKQMEAPPAIVTSLRDLQTQYVYRKIDESIESATLNEFL